MRSVPLKPGEPELPCAVFDRTPFHPQGGGQPSDQGTVAPLGGGGAPLALTTVRAAPDGAVLHFLAPADAAALAIGARAALHVDAAWRATCARLHSAGHAIDAAMAQLGFRGEVRR